MSHLMQDLIDVTGLAEGNPHRVQAFDRLAAFLQSPAVMALADPALRAAAEVLISEYQSAVGYAAEIQTMGDEDLRETIRAARISIRSNSCFTRAHAAAQAMSAEQRSCEAAKAQADGEVGCA